MQVTEHERVSADNIYIFGMTAPEASEIRAHYDPRAHVEASAPLREVVEQMSSGFFSPEDPNRYHPLVDLLVGSDYFLVAADFDAYYETQRRIDADFRDADAWSRMAALNTAHSGWFSSDRTIRGYAQDIWRVESLL